MTSVHPNYIKASNLTLLYLPLGIIVGFFSSKIPLTSPKSIAVLLLMIIFGLGQAYLIRQGYSWIKFFLLFFLFTAFLKSIPGLILVPGLIFLNSSRLLFGEGLLDSFLARGC
jgi:hypothetical protein